MAQKTNTASEFTHRFSTVEGFFCYPKCSILVTHRFSMYAWVTYGEKEINEIMSTHIIIGYKQMFPTDIPYMEKPMGFLYNRWLFYLIPHMLSEGC